MTAELQIYDVIGWGGVSAKDFVAQLNALPAGPVTVCINSPGGDVWDGLAIHAALAARADVTVRIDGLAGSMASVVAMAGETVQIAENAFFMIHDPTAEVGGGAAQLRSRADGLEKIAATMRDVYAKRTGQTPETVAQWMSAETWWNATEAVAVGLADEIIPGLEAAASLRTHDLSKFKNAPAALKERSITMTALPKTLAELKLIESPTASEEVIVAQLRANATKADAARLESVLAHLDGVRINAEVRAQILRAGPSELHATAKALAEEQRKAVEARASALAAELLASVGHRQPLPADHPAKTQTNGSDLEARYQDHLRKVSSSRRPA